MFGRKAREAKAREEQARKEEHERERNAHWARLIDRAKDEHEMTRIFVEYRQEVLFDWLNDFDRRTAREMREHARAAQWQFWAMVMVLLNHHWLP
jgi:hypothetical protein